jgi:hypothetical protein
MQATQVATQYLNDQLREDMARDDLVSKRKMSRHDADLESDAWAEVRPCDAAADCERLVRAALALGARDLADAAGRARMPSVPRTDPSGSGGRASRAL